MQAITVSQLSGYLKQIFEAEELLHDISVIGEVFGVSTSRQVTYFQLKDENAVLSCVCFYPALAGLIQEGKQVIATGSMNYYVKGGKLSFNVFKVEEVGQGKLFEEFLKLKQKLELEGLFDASHKKPMPKEIKRIGVITSKDGAVIQDIKNVAWRRNPSVDIVLYPVKVQGKLCESEVSHAIEVMSQYDKIDVIIVARGGGSLEDLSGYNTESVARATYNCTKPIVSAVGHETDFTIIDFVSDLRSPTPSAAAELLTSDVETQKEGAEKLFRRLKNLTTSFIADRFALVTNYVTDITKDFEHKLQVSLERFSSIKVRLVSAMETYLTQSSFGLGLYEQALSKLNPRTILKQGYAKIEQAGKSVNLKQEVDLNKNLKIIFADGEITARPQKEEK